MEVADYSAGFNDPFIDPYKIYSWATLLVSEYKYLIYVAIAAWLVIELLFWMVIHFSLIPKLQPLNPPLNYTGCSLDLVTKILDTMDSLDSYTFDKFVEGFFRGSKVSDLREDNIRSFLCWAMFGKREGTLTPDQSEKISAAYDMVITRYRLDIPKGFNPSVRHVAMTWEPVNNNYYYLEQKSKTRIKYAYCSLCLCCRYHLSIDLCCCMFARGSCKSSPPL